MNSSTYFTNRNGRACKIIGDDEAIASLCAILEAAGVPWNDDLQTWDEGFYEEDEPDAVRLESGWVAPSHSTQRL